MYHHRVTIDFSHDDEVKELLPLLDGFVDVIRERFHAKDVWVSDYDVTEDYEEAGVAVFNTELSDFLESLHFKDYPPR